MVGVVGQVVARRPVVEVGVADDPERLQGLERAVDRRGRQRRATVAGDLRDDVLGGGVARARPRRRARAGAGASSAAPALATCSPTSCTHPTLRFGHESHIGRTYTGRVLDQFEETDEPARARRRSVAAAADARDRPRPGGAARGRRRRGIPALPQPHGEQERQARQPAPHARGRAAPTAAPTKKPGGQGRAEHPVHRLGRARRSGRRPLRRHRAHARRRATARRSRWSTSRATSTSPCPGTARTRSTRPSPTAGRRCWCGPSRAWSACRSTTSRWSTSRASRT